MNMGIKYTNGSTETISNVVRHEKRPADGSKTFMDYSDGLPAYKPTNIIVHLADGSERTLSGIETFQFLSDEEIANGYRFAFLP